MTHEEVLKTYPHPEWINKFRGWRLIPMNSELLAGDSLVRIDNSPLYPGYETPGKGKDSVNELLRHFGAPRTFTAMYSQSTLAPWALYRPFQETSITSNEPPLPLSEFHSELAPLP